MTEYAKKTCNICGARDIQPNMVRKQKKVKTGKSRETLGVGTIAGIFLENKQSAKRLRKYLWANNNRTYTRYREVWMCQECAGVKPKTSNPEDPDLGPINNFIFGTIVPFGIVVIGLWGCFKFLS